MHPIYNNQACPHRFLASGLLMLAYRLMRSNKESPGIGGVDFGDIEQKIGIDTFLTELTQEIWTIQGSDNIRLVIGACIV